VEPSPLLKVLVVDSVVLFRLHDLLVVHLWTASGGSSPISKPGVQPFY